MLVLTRTPGEWIDVYVEGRTDPLLSIKVADVTHVETGKKIRLAFHLPDNVIVMRRELDPPAPFVKPSEGSAA